MAKAQFGSAQFTSVHIRKSDPAPDKVEPFECSILAPYGSVVMKGKLKFCSRICSCAQIMLLVFIKHFSGH